MRILYVIDSLKVGGAEVLLLSMIRDYRARGFDITLGYFSDGPLRREFEALGVSPLRLSRAGLKNPLAFIRLLQQIRHHKPDVIHTHLRKSDLIGQFCAALLRVPVRVSTAHNADPWRRNKLLTFIEQLFTGGCQCVIAVSTEVQNYLIEVAGYNPNKVVAIPNGINLERFNPATVQPLDKTAYWGFEPQTPVIGIIGRLETQKDHDTFLAAARLVINEVASARFVIIGDGPRRQTLEANRKTLQLENQVVFAGLLRNMPEVIASLDIVVFSSLWEGLPVALLEAMAMNRAIVATNVGGIPGLITHNHSGILVPPGDAHALAQGMLRLLRDPGFAQQLALQCRPLIQAQFSVSTMHDRILNIYQRSADQSGE